VTIAGDSLRTPGLQTGFIRWQSGTEAAVAFQHGGVTGLDYIF